jgi:membrane protein implicated in regulation of membrane protease activity
MLAGSGTVDCAYFITFAIGLVWAIFVLVAGGSGEADVPDADVDSFDIGSVEVSPISPITISTFITTFGGIGIITRQAFGFSVPASLVAATGSGLLLSGLMFLFYTKFLIGSQGSSEVQVQQLVGQIAEVTVPISKKGVGKIALVAQRARVTYPARSSGRTAIERGTLVVIDQMMGAQALVSPKDSASSMDI